MRTLGRAGLTAIAGAVLLSALFAEFPAATWRSGAASAQGQASPAAVPTTSSGAATYNLRVVSDASPDLTDLDSFVASTTSQWTTDRDKVWALYYWTHILRRQTAPMVLHGYEVTDPIRNFNDYGFAMCSTISGINQVLFESLGLRHQYWDICNHTVAAVEYDGSFHMVDSSMSNLVTREDGVTLAGVEEIAANSGRLAKLFSLYSTSPNGFLTGSDTGRNLSPFVGPDGGVIAGYSGVFCADGLKRRDYYYNWNAGHRYVLNVREHESYTRYYRKLGDTREFWVGSESVSNPDPNDQFDIESFNRFGIRGNGRWTFAPSLAPDAYGRALYRQRNVTAYAGGGIRPATAGLAAEAIYKVDAANAIASQKIRAVFLKTDPGSSAAVSVSVNQGRTWTTPVPLAAQTGSAVPLELNVRDEVSGQTEALVRVQMTAASAAPEALVLQDLRIETTTQVNAKALPRLHLGKNRIHVGAGDQLQTMTLWPELRGDRWQRDVTASANVASQPINVPRPWEGVVFAADASQEASLTYRMDAPADLARVVYGGRLNNRGTNARIEFWHSFDEGKSWTMSYRLTNNTAPWDVIHYATVTDIPQGARSVLFKYTMRSDGSAAGRPAIFSLRMEAQHQPAVSGARPVEVTLRWKEVGAGGSVGQVRSHKQRVTGFPFEYDVHVGGEDHPVMESLTVNLQGFGDAAPLGYGDGVNAGGEKFLYRWRTDGTNLAAGRPYTFSRAPSGFQSSAGAGNTTILTDGVVGSPQSGGTSYYWGQCWNAGTLTLTVDLGQARQVGAARIHLFGYPAWDALAAQVQDRVEVLTSLDGSTWASQGFLDPWVRRKDVPINHMLMDDERATGWNFEHLLPAPAGARYVRYRIDSSRILCTSELQVFDRIDYRLFDASGALPGSSASVALTAPFSGATLSGTAVVSASVTGTDVTGVTFFASGAAIGSDSSAPYSMAWDTTGVANGTYTLTAEATTTSGDRVTSAPRTVTVQNNGHALPRTGWIASASLKSSAAVNAIDGNAGTRWDTGTGMAAGQWFQVDMRTATTFDRVVLDASGSPGDYPRGYRVSVSDNGTSWVDVAAGAGSSAIVNVGFSSQTKRFLRVTQTATAGSWWSIHEFQVYSATASPPPPPPPSGPTPYLGTPVSLPGTVEAENFDNGGSGVAYADTTSTNQGGAYRPTEAVDLEGSGAAFNVGWISTGEWLVYSVNVAQAGTYRARLRVASPNATGTGQVSLTFGSFTTPVAGVPNTGAWSTFQEMTIGGLTLAAGPQLMRVNAVRSGWNLDKIILELEAAPPPPPPPPPSGPTPYLGTAVSVPGTVEAENYDNGGSGVAYSDTTSTNQGGAYRPAEAVDIEGGAGTFNVGWISTGEWLLYSVNVAQAGTYRARLRVASPNATGTGQVSLTFGSFTTPVAGVPNTGAWSTFQEMTVAGLALAAGPQLMRVNAVRSGWNLDKIILELEGAPPPPPVPTPYGGTPVTLPGLVEAENFDNGGSGVAYLDANPQNSGGVYRPAEGVDVEATTDTGGGFNVGWMAGGEWLAYTVNVPAAGTYSLQVRVAANGSGGRFHLEAGGVDVSGPLIIPNTGGWQIWTTLNVPVVLPAGVQTLRLVLDANGPTGVFGNINWLRFGATTRP